MKLIVVNASPHLSTPRLKAFFHHIFVHFLTKKIRNKKELSRKKEISLVFLNKKEMKKINLQFRTKNKATDVLSFSSEDPDSLGELLFCVEVLKMQAKQQGHSFEQEFLYMLIHGLLHLLGYDHELSKKEEKLMFRLQDQCFSLLNKDYVSGRRIIRS
jgi:probable rRNA maturation factor